MGEARIRPGAGPRETAAIKRLHELYTKPEEERRGLSMANVLEDLDRGYRVALGSNGLLKGVVDEKKGTMPFISDFDLKHLAEDNERSTKLVAELKDFEMAMKAVNCWAIAQGGQDYWTLATFDMRREAVQQGDDGTSLGRTVQKVIEQKREELAGGKKGGGERVNVRFN